jgi:hypothetical protein
MKYSFADITFLKYDPNLSDHVEAGDVVLP